jgi:probable phosphoglycerate mutase
LRVQGSALQNRIRQWPTALETLDSSRAVVRYASNLPKDHDPMDILFARHGNTFGPGDKVVWVGRETDLPLVDKGWVQARAFGAALSRLGLPPDRIVTAALLRTRSFADTVAATLESGPQPRIDPRLNEVDYGAWAGRTSEEIAASPEGAAALAGWNARDAWPVDAGWVTTEAELFGALRSFVDEVIAGADAASRLLVVSSNGILRFLPRMLGAIDPARSSYVMKTGHAGLISGTPGNFRLRFWNLDPEVLSEDFAGLCPAPARRLASLTS